MLNLRRFATAVLVVLVSVLGMGSPTVMALGDTSGPRIITDDTGAHTYDRVNPLSGPYSESALRRGPPPEVLAATLRESASVQGFGDAAETGADGAANVANGVRLRAQLAGREISGGHAFEKHVVEIGEFPGIRTRAEFADVIERVVTNGELRPLSSGRSAYWRDGVVVIRNPRAADGGTAFVPKNGYDYFLGLT
jgi:hypothetical protein